MPLNSAQLAALVERARQKGPPVVTPSPAPAAQRPVRARQGKPTLATQPPPAPRPPALAAVPPPLSSPAPTPEHTAEAGDAPIGWYLAKSSWQFHRRFFVVFRRPMRPGEYTQLFKQIRRGEAEHLGADCWRVTLPDGRTTLPVRAARWRLITILPKNWQPPTPVAAVSGGSKPAQEPSL
jgi:hypothetical protein